MKPRPRVGLVLTGLAASIALAASTACETGDPAQAVVDNRYPAPADAGSGPETVVYRVWWNVTLFPAPLAAGAESDANRVVAASDYAYALLAPGWDATSSDPPAQLVAVRTKVKLGVARGDTLHIAIDDTTVDGNCAAGSALSQDDADFITTRIFPGAFAGGAYQAASCTFLADADADAGAAADARAGADASANASASADGFSAPACAAASSGRRGDEGGRACDRAPAAADPFPPASIPR